MITIIVELTTKKAVIKKKLQLSLELISQNQLVTQLTSQNYNHGHNFLRIFDVLPNFPVTKSGTKPDY